MSKETVIIIRTNDGVISQTIIPEGEKPLLIKAQAGVTYELKDVASNVAPDQVLLSRHGNNLKIHITPKHKKGKDDENADVIIEGYYDGAEGDLIGLAEDGQYYNYVPQEGSESLLVSEMDSGATSYSSLGVMDTDSFSMWPVALGLLALGAGAAAGSGGGSSTSVVAPISDSAPEPSNNLGEVILDGNPTKGSTLEAMVSDPDGVVGAPVYSWTIDGKEVPNSNQRSLTLVQEYVGKEIFVTATYIDTFGQAIVVSTKVTVVDTTPPGQTTVSIPEATDGINAAEASGGVAVEVTLPSDAVEGDVITVSINDSTPVDYTVTQGDVIAGVPVVIMLPPADISNAGQGTATVTTTYTDPSGNAITPITTNVVIDTLIPGMGTETPASVSIPEATDGINATEASDGIAVEVTLPSDAVAGDVITVSIDGGTSTEHIVTQDDINAGTPVIAILPEAAIDAAGQGTATITTTYTDPSGNAITPITTNVVIDTIAPDSPTTTSMSYEDNVGDIRGLESTAPTTDDTLPGVNVGIGLADVPSLYIDGSLVESDYDSVHGTLTPTMPLVDGVTYDITYTLTDAAGNESGKSPVLTITIDTTPPNNTDIDSISLTDDVETATGPILDDATTNDPRPTYAGTIASGADVVSVKIYDNGTQVGTADVNSGVWTFTPASDLSDSGVHNFTVSAMDAAGNEGLQTALAGDGTDTFTVNTSAVATPFITSLSDDESDKTGDFSSGVITNDNTPVINGTTTVGTTVHVYDNGVLLVGTATVVGTTWSFAMPDLLGILNLNHTITATATNAAGTVSAFSGPFAFLIDTTAPGEGGSAGMPVINGVDDNIVPVKGNVVNNGFTNDTTPTLSGDAEAGSIIKVYDSSTLLGETTASGTGTWSYTHTSATDGTTYNYHVTATDQAGNVSANSNDYAITIDTSKPSSTGTDLAITSVVDDQGTVTGSITSGDTTDDSNPALNGIAEAGSTVTIYDNGTPIGTTIATGGNWTFTPVTSLITGNHSFTITATDAAGNISDPSAAFILTLIGAGNPTTASTIDTYSDDVGVIVGNLTAPTTDDTAIVLNGTVTAIKVGEVVNVYGDDAFLGTATVSGSVWTYAINTPSSSTTYTVKVANAAGNVKDGTGSLNIVLDSLDPTTTVTIAAISTDSGIVGDYTTNDTDGLTISATLGAALAPDETLQYSRDNGVVWIDISASEISGTSVTHVDTGLTSSTTIQMRVIDAAGNTGPVDAQDITILGNQPSTTININSISDDTGSSATDFITNDNNGLTIHATLSAELLTGEVLKYSTDGSNWVDITAFVSGTTVTYTDATLTGTKTIYMQVEDIAANSGPQAIQEIVIDTSTSGTATATIDSISLDTGISSTDFITKDNNGLTIKATLTAALGTGETLEYSRDNGATWTDITPSVSGMAVSYDDTGLTSTSTIQMRVLDIAGNPSTADVQLVTIDTVAPSSFITVSIVGISDDSGTVGDYITNDTDGLTISATLGAALAPDETLQYSRDNGVIWIDIPASEITGGVNVSHIDAGLTSSTTIQMRVIDAVGNIGQSDSQAITIIGTGPSTSVTFDSITNDTGSSATDFITNDNDGLSIGATLSAGLLVGEKLLYSTDGSIWSDITSFVSGMAVTYSDTTLTTTKTVFLKVEDSAGTSGPVTTQLVTIDTSANTNTVSIDSISLDTGISSTDFITKDNNGLTVKATLTAALGTGETLEYSRDGGTTWIDITSSITGGTNVSYGDSLLISTNTIEMRVKDVAGNPSMVDTQLVTIDTIAPTKTITINSISDDTGSSSTDFITNDNNGLTISATLSAPLAVDEVVQYSRDGGNTWITLPADAITGAAVSYLDASLTQSTTIGMRVTDVAGNAGAEDQQAIIIDTSAVTNVVNIVSITNDTGTSSTDFITNDNDGLTIGATLTSSLGAGETLWYSTNGVNWIDITTSVSGATVNYNAPLTTTEMVSMQVINRVGTKGAIETQLITIDTIKPNAPEAPNMTDSTDTGISNSDNITKDTTPSFTISTPGVGETPKLYADGLFVPTMYDALTHTLTPMVVLVGNPIMTVTLTDIAGNESLPSVGLPITIDVTPPTLTVVSPDAVYNVTPTITGASDAIDGTKVSVTVTQGATTQTLFATVSGGEYSVGVTTPLEEGAYTATATVSDAAGNPSMASNTGSVLINEVPVAVNDINLVANDASMSIYSGLFRFYDTMLGREPDMGGYNYYITNLTNGTLTPAKVAQLFLDANPDLASLTNVQFVSQLVANAYGRPPTVDEQIDFTTMLINGMTRVNFSMMISESPESILEHSDPFYAFAVANTLPTEVFVSAEDNNVMIPVGRLLANDTDADGDTLIVTSVQDATHGIVSLASGVITFVPEPNYFGPTSFTYTVSDDHGGVDTATFSWTIAAVNDGDSVITGDTIGNGVTAQPITGDLNASDLDGLTDGSYFTVTGNPANGTAAIDPATGEWSYTSNSGYEGADSFIVTVTDDKGFATTQAIDLGVTNTQAMQYGVGIRIVMDTNNDRVIDSVEKGSNTKTNVEIDIPSTAQVGDIIKITNDTTGSTLATYTLTAGDIGTIKTISNVTLPPNGETLIIKATVNAGDPDQGITTYDSASISGSNPVVNASGTSTFFFFFTFGSAGLSATDADNDIVSVVVEAKNSGAVATASAGVAAELGLSVVDSGATLTITKLGGGTIDSTVLSEFLNTVTIHSNGGFFSTGEVIITATDTAGHIDTDTGIGGGFFIFGGDLDIKPNLIEGTSVANTLNGTSNNDYIYGYAGDDVLSGDSGNDVMRGGEGADTLNGGNGNDTLIGDAGADTIYGNIGNDSIAYDASNILVDGGAGTDALYFDGNAIVNLNLADVAGTQIKSIEKIDITGNTDNTLTVSYADVFAMSDTDTLYIAGNFGDTVDLTGQVFVGQATVDGLAYNTYNLGGSSAADIYVYQYISVI